MTPPDPSDHDLLIRIDERVTKLDKCLTTHLGQHWAVTLLAFGAIVSAAFSILLRFIG